MDPLRRAAAPILLLALALPSTASASGWGPEEGVRYRTYRSPAEPAPAPAAPTAPAWIWPWVAVGPEGVTVWAVPWCTWTPGLAPFPAPSPLPSLPDLKARRPPAGGVSK